MTANPFAHAHRGRITDDGLMSFAPNPTATLSERIVRLIDAANVAENAKQTPRDYLGGSRLGHHCERFLYFEYTHTPKDEGRDFTGRTLRIFRDGHRIEDQAAADLRAAGFDLLTEKRDGGQFGFGVAPHPITGRPRISGHLDGVFIGGPAFIKYPCLWEMKSMKAEKWKAFKDSGVAKSHPIYYAQMQVYMAYMELTDHPALFTSYNKNTSEYWFELVPFDGACAQAASDRGVRVISAAGPCDLPRCARDNCDYRCKVCDFRATCWSMPQ